jgi:hypothetical protein
MMFLPLIGEETHTKGSANFRRRRLREFAVVFRMLT